MRGSPGLPARIARYLLKPKRLILFILLLGLSALPVFNRDESEGRLVFSHRKHVVEGRQDCALCHPDADSSTQLDELKMRGSASCFTCHDTSFIRYEPAADGTDSFRVPLARFSHKAHLHGKVRLKCPDCHPGIDSAESNAKPHRISMEECMLCHEGLPGEYICMLCHARGTDLRPRDHRSGWLALHGAEAQATRVKCALCHDEFFCTRCHDDKAPLPRMAHPPNFMRSHAIAAHGRQQGCLMCHDEETDCTACHREKLPAPR